MWNDGSSGQTLSTSSVGEYIVEITDGNGCVVKDTVNVTGINALPTVSVNDASICPSDPAVTFTATCATAVSYVWSGNASGTNNYFCIKINKKNVRR